MKWMPIAVVATAVGAFGQPYGLEQTDFPASEFQERRAKVFEKIGRNALALIPGAASADSPQVFRQSNEFYYLTGVSAPHCYLLLDGRSRKTLLFIPHRDPGRERQIGSLVSAEDRALIIEKSGVDEVHGPEALGRLLWPAQVHLPAPALYVPFSPSEGVSGSRDERLRQIAEAASDPWDGRPSRTGQFLTLLRERFPTFELRDLSPILDPMRLIKSPREVSVIRRASRIAGLAMIEAIRSTRPGVFEYQLDAAARYVHLLNDAKHEGYPSIVGGGKNAWHGHYFRNGSVLKSGDMVLMDYAPDYHNYTSDITRMWPVNGVYTPDQRALCDFILAYRDALIKRVRPGVTPDQVLDDASTEMAGFLKSLKFTKDIYRKGAEEALKFRGHLSHPVGMTVHDVGNYRKGEFMKGVVFSIDPMLWIPEENMYVRMEDVVVVTDSGVENFTDFLPAKPDDIEKLMREDGLLQLRAPMAK